MDVFVVVAFAAVGLAVGSFLNVVVYRVPRNESVVRPRSRCPECGVEISSRDNIPVVSWLILRGRCRSCGTRISARYLFVELATTIIWVACAVRFDSIEQRAFASLAMAILLALSLIDLEHRRLPNAIVLPSTAAAIAWVVGLAIAERDISVVGRSLICGAAAFGLFFLIALVSGGMGFGDVKLAAFVGVVTGRFAWQTTLAAILIAFIGGGLLAIGLLAIGRKGRKDAIPFGPAIAGGAAVALFVGASGVHRVLGV